MEKNNRPTIPKMLIDDKERIEVCIPSRGRTWNLVCMLQALRTQTFQLWDLTIVDDNPDDNLKANYTLNAMLKLLEMEGHRTRVIKGMAKGLSFAHGILLAATKKRLIARLDDDTLPADIHYLALLMDLYHNDDSGFLGAVGGPIPDFKGGTKTDYQLPPKEELQKFAPFENPAIRFLQPEGSKPGPMISLYSSFIYKRLYFEKAGGFALSYSPMAEKEDTDILLRISFLGARLMCHPDAVLWHLKAPSGGIRHVSENDRQTQFESDYRNFVARATRLRDRTFSWEDESAMNLTPFEKYREQISDDDTGYIELG